VSAETRLIWSLAWRFVRGRRTRLLAGTTWAAFLATALGVAAMVIAMALMTGYRHDLQAKLVQGSAAVVAYPIGDLAEEVLDEDRRALSGIEGVASAQRVVYGQGSLASESWRDGREVMLRGIESSEGLESVCSLQVLPGAPEGAGAVKLVVGRELYRALGVREGELLRLMVLSLATGRPRFEYRSAVVSATCATGFSEFDRQWVLLEREELEGILGAGVSSSVLEVGVERVGVTSAVAARVRSALGPDYLISDFFDLNRELFTALRIQQLMLFLVLGLIVLVSTFNTASSLVVMVRERRRDLGVLSALGLSPAQHQAVFLRYGLLLGVLGTLLGIGLGALAAWSMNEFELIRFDPEVAAIYFLSSVPFRLAARDLAAVGLFTLAVTLLACWLPARRAGRIQPADALRNE
jgi:lipoprotein-releasing system permease protein